MCTIKKCVPEYTGGGIYSYYGTLNEENMWFLTADEWGSVLLLNENPRLTEEAFDVSWQQAHTIAEILDADAEEFRKQMLQWVLDNKPKSNYTSYEIEERLVELEKSKKG